MREAPKLKKFYSAVEAAPRDGGYAILLDSKPARTKAGSALSHSSKALMNAVAEEWRAQDERIDPAGMPLTTMLMKVVDAEPETIDFWAREVASYLGSDLICYRAEKPDELAARQSEAWSPFHEWMKQEFGVNLIITSGISAVAQDAVQIERVRELLKEQDAATLLGIYSATGITGSAAMALAAWKQAFPASAIFAAARVDEHFQEEKWGVDSEAKEREHALQADFHAAYRFLSLLSA